jgi:hypothetical protein
VFSLIYNFLFWDAKPKYVLRLQGGNLGISEHVDRYIICLILLYVF